MHAPYVPVREYDSQRDPRERKFHQAAFVYLHVGILYEASVYVFWRNGVLRETRGPIWLWLLLGAAVVALVFWLLWWRRSVWTARIVWGLGVLRLPALIGGAFFPAPGATIPQAFYLVALLLVLVNLAFLARAAWDL